MPKNLLVKIIQFTSGRSYAFFCLGNEELSPLAVPISPHRPRVVPIFATRSLRHFRYLHSAKEVLFQGLVSILCSGIRKIYSEQTFFDRFFIRSLCSLYSFHQPLWEYQSPSRIRRKRVIFKWAWNCLQLGGFDGWCRLLLRFAWTPHREVIHRCIAENVLLGAASLKLQPTCGTQSSMIPPQFHDFPFQSLFLWISGNFGSRNYLHS